MAQQFSGSPYLNSYGVQDRYGYNGEVSPDVAIEEQALNRKQQIANLLMQQGLQGAGQGQMVGRFYVPTSASQHAAKIGELLAGLAGTHGVDRKRAALATDMNAERARAVQAYVKNTSPTQIQPEMAVDSILVPPTFDIDQLQPDAAREQVRHANQNAYANTAAPGEIASGALTDKMNAMGRMMPYPQAAMTDRRIPVGAPVETPADPVAARQAVMQALSHQDPRVREAVRFLEQAKAQDEEKRSARAFQEQQNEENRQVRREGIEANALTRVEQMKNTMALTQMQIDARLQAGQDANALKKQLADQEADLKKLELQMKRETLQQGKTPAGYRQTAEGNLEAIPGGPADTKLQGALNADTSMLQGTNASMDRLATAANALLNHPGLAGITGVRGKVPDIPGSDAANARADLNNLKSQIAFTVMQELRNNSKSGSSGLGALSDAEGKRLEAAIASLDTTQGIDQFKHRLQSIIDYANGAKDRLRDAFNMKHKTGEPKPMAPDSQGPKVGTVESGYRYKGGDPSKTESWEKVQ